MTWPNAHDDLPRLSNAKPPAGWLRTLAKTSAPKGMPRCLNLVYNGLWLDHRKSFYDLFAKIFREDRQSIAQGEWWVKVGDKWVALPLGRHDAWLEWDLAVSLLGHEVDVEHSYLDLIRFRRPRLSFNIGANYGLHSKCFSVHGVPTVSFEPNVSCLDYFQRLARRNNLPCDLHPVALGAEEGSIDVAFPERESWLG